VRPCADLRLIRTWQLVITGTTIVAFLMIFVIQNTQRRDTQAMQLKPDELTRVNDTEQIP
jgi:low affinity Fe/Cu permease